MTSALKPLLANLMDGRALSAAQAEAAFDAIMRGEEAPAAIASFLTALRMRGETLTEIAAAARCLRAHALTIQAPPDAIDMCGTGGDAAHTFNISTTASFVVAALGVPVAKHGNRAVSSKSGAADVLAELGVQLDMTPATAQNCLTECGITFLFAVNHHPAMRHVAPIRAALGVRTIFNLLGPLASPANVKRQLVGVYSAHWVRPIAEVLRVLGAERAIVAHGDDGLDELTTTGATDVAILQNAEISYARVTPEDAGLTRARPSDLVGGAPKANAETLRNVLSGAPGPLRDVVCLNAAAALMVADKAADLGHGVALAQGAIDRGDALRKLESFIQLSHGQDGAT